MSSFDEENLFASGPHRFQVGGLTLRKAVAESPGSRGVRVSSLGQQGRSILQTGDLLADDPAAMRLLLQAIEAKVDGLAHMLVDDLGNSWPNVVMLAFEPIAAGRAGRRYRTSYRVEYLQVSP